jgi:hypothetical protein
MNAPLVTPWTDSAAPTQSVLRQRMVDEGLSPYSWANGPFDVYSAHSIPTIRSSTWCKAASPLVYPSCKNN